MKISSHLWPWEWECLKKTIRVAKICKPINDKKKNITCYNFKQVGHYKTECTKPSRYVATNSKNVEHVEITNECVVINS